ncbi:unnamed protein product [Absidia cylindrospora]
MLYFPITKAKDWNLIEALSVYDENHVGLTFNEILQKMDIDLTAFSIAQASNKKYVDPLRQQIKKLFKLNCLRGVTVAGEDPPSPPIQSTSKPTVSTTSSETESDERLPGAINPVKISKLINEKGVVNIATHHHTDRKRPIESSRPKVPVDSPSTMV